MDQINAAAAITDQTAAPTAFAYEPPAAGYTTARFVGYVEVGKQPQRAFEGVEKPDAAEVRLTFELNGPKHITEYEHEGVKKTRTNVIRITSTISNHEKSNFYKLLQKMIYGRTGINHMAQMLGEGFLVKITHNASKKDPKKIFANMKSDVWNIGEAMTVDPMTDIVTKLDVPEASIPQQLLLWNSPSAEQWDTIFIDGEYEREVDGVKVMKSKNFIQELAMSASNFVGSPLEAMVSIGALNDIIPEVKAPVAPVAPAAPVAAEDPLAALGLV